MQTPQSQFFIDEAGHLAAEDGGDVSAGRQTSRHICHILGVRDESTRNKLSAAVRQAARKEGRSVLLLGSEEDRRMVTVRPARETGWAVVTSEDVLAPVSHLETSALIDVFALSPAEAEIALMLAQGSTLAEVAERRLVQPETVKGQIKGLLRKVGVGNQKQLAGLLAQLGTALNEATGALRPARST